MILFIGFDVPHREGPVPHMDNLFPRMEKGGV